MAPYLALLPEDAGQRRYPLRESFNGLRYLVKTGAPWRWMPNDLPPWELVYQQTQRWLAAGCFAALVHDLRVLLRLERGRNPEPTAVVIDSRTLQSTPDSGHRAGWDGAKRRKGSKVHTVVDTLGHLLALHVTPADAGDRAEVAHLAEAVQDITAQTVAVAFVDQGYTGEASAEAAAEHGIRLDVVKLPEAKTRLCFAAQAVGGRAILRLGHPLPSPCPRLRTPARDRPWPPLPRLRLPHAQAGRPGARSLTASSLGLP